MGTVASVVVSNSARNYDKQYDYIVPEALKEEIKPGIRVIVPFGKGNRLLEAYVFKVSDIQDCKALKEICQIIDASPVLSVNMLKLAAWMKYRYICTYSDAIKAMLPPGIGVKSLCMVRLEKTGEVRAVLKNILESLKTLNGECTFDELKALVNSRSLKKYLQELKDLGLVSTYETYSSKVGEKTMRVAYLAMSRDEVLEEIESSRIKKIQQIRILEMLIDNEYISVADIIRFSGVSRGVVETLKKHGYIDYKDIAIKRDPLKDKPVLPTSPMKPTSQQAAVIKHISCEIDKGAFSEVLLHGVTGSGKTEVYLQLIRHCLDMNRTAIALVPEISLTPQMVERFKGRFGNAVAVLHSRLSLGERYDQWRLIRDGKIKVVVGARSAVFAPLDNIGIIVIDEEHENTYKSETTPKYNAKEVARERCRDSGAILLYASATPSVESFYNSSPAEHGIQKGIRLLEMRDRANSMVMPEVELVDMRRELEEGNRTLFSRRLTEEITKNLDSKQQTILFLNKRGHSSFVLCRSCGYTVMCVNCNVSMTYHLHDDRLICHYCGYTVKNPVKCPRCQSNYIKHFGTGTQKVEEEIKKAFSNCSVLRMDMDTTTYKNSHEDILKAFREQNTGIMIGTQMIAKGHDFPNVTLVGVLAADSLLNTGDYRSSERTFQLITQVAGRAGRGLLPGRVIIQTYNTEDFSILSACSHDYHSFYKQEISVREKLNYPPFTNIATIILSGINDRMVFNAAKETKNALEAMPGAKDVMELLGPSRAPLQRIKTKYRWRILIKCGNIDRLINILSQLSDNFYKKKGNNTVGFGIDINPLNML
ncbi:primosomal protein N' [Anaerobacterium chartisolvens]|uniref:primosomal protein N' n=1 Tax=Anaerobacterium chartisolvens TaxID=1297424 RepID=UPI000DF31AB9|nr:primosomal protein N' [Anaerobacterium chartisolvens]